ncbi:sensor histidine kinase [Roseateles chitinivorans]|uniref:sensor histidine kinase n=1 Tax=Roseateles chitinivorans TaxID=2917965 RepID=UPI003D66BF9D
MTSPAPLQTPRRLSSSLSSSLSLSQQFLLVSFPVLLASTLVIGWWVGRQVEESVVHRIGGDTALYVDGFIAPHLDGLNRTGQIGDADRRALEALVVDADWARRIVSLRIWRPDGVVLFSSDGEGVGQKLEVDEGLEVAAAGSVYSEITVRRGRQQADHGQPLERMIETYTPIHTAGRGHIGAIAEFYQMPDEIDREAGSAQRRGWLIVAGTMLATYLLLFLLVRRGSLTIVAQRNELREKLAQLTAMHVQNDALNARVRRAAEDAISINEALLQRVSADVHDGPSQDLGFALMQIKNLRDAQAARTSDAIDDAIDDAMADAASVAKVGAAAAGTSAGAALAGDLDRISDAVQAAMRDLRAISADLELPELEPLSLDAVAARVVRDFEAKTQGVVPVTLETAVDPALPSPLRIKTTLYRLLQESLANVFRHARGSRCRVALRTDASGIRLAVDDDGPGFDPAQASARRRLGLSGMRQRVESQGGTFGVTSAPGAGTSIRVDLPLTARPGGEDGMNVTRTVDER